MARKNDPLDRLREIALALPEAHEVKAWGEPTFRVNNKMFATYAAADSHHGAGRPAAWIKAEPGEQELRIRADPERYFRPPYVGPSGWIGVQLDRRVAWDDVAELLAAGWRLAAPKKLLRELEAAAGASAGAGPPRSKPKPGAPARPTRTQKARTRG
jgi:hypothetical protein